MQVTQRNNFTFISPEAFYELEKWMNYRMESGEKLMEKVGF